MTSSQRHRVALVVLSTLCALAWSFSSVGAVTVMNELPLQGCANIIRQLEGDNILVTLNGSRSAFHAPPYEGADYDLLSSLYFQWTDIREVGRNGAACSASLDTVVFAQNLHLCSCSITPILEVHDGATKSGWNLTISGCPSPQRDLVATAQVTVTNATFVEEFNYTMPGSTADAFNYTNAAGSIKFGFHVTGWTWNTTASDYTNNTYLGVGLQYGFETPRNLTVTQSRTPLGYFVGTYFGTTQMKITMDLGYLLDGVPTVTIGEKTEFPLNLPDGTSLFAIDTPFHFCQPTFSESDILNHWNNIYYDPSIEVIFGDLNAPVSPSQRSSKRAIAIAVPVVFVSLIIIVATIILLVLYVPSVRNVIMPYNDQKARRLRQSSTQRESWRPATLPSE